MINILYLLIASLFGYALFHMTRHNALINRIITITIGVLTLYGIFIFVSGDKIAPDESNTIIAGTTADFPPFEFIDKGEIVGFDIDVAKEVAQRLDKKIIFKDMPFSTLIPMIQLGKIHMIAAGMTPTPERSKQVNFTKPYLEGDPFVIVTLKKNKITNMDDLNGKDVVVNEGYTADLYMSDIKGPNLKRLKDTTDAFLALKSGRAYAFVTARNTAQPFLEKQNKDLFTTFIIEGTGETAAFALSKQYPELVDSIQTALDNILKDGTLKKLKRKWNIL